MIYYAETNLIAIVVGAILLLQGQKITSRNETSQIIMNWMLRVMILLSISDIAAYWFRGKSYLGVEITNTVYFMTMALGAYSWFLYILVKMGYSSDLKRTIIRTGLPMLLLCVAIIINPMTGYFFTVDEQNLYHRGSGIVVVWIVEWGYMLAALAVNIRAMLSERRSYRRSEYRGYLIFAVPIAVTAVSQMMFYGTTTTQIGFMIAMLMAFLNRQHYQVQRDELTGLNNRNAFLSYQDALFSRASAFDLTVFMVDADNFKTINDTYGHLKGDQALKDISNALKAAAGAMTESRVILFRYGGDEFVIIGQSMTGAGIRSLRDAIAENLEQINARNRASGEKYSLSVSVGDASGDCADSEAFDRLMKNADHAMYQEKRKKKTESVR